jgi:hypothetical protein
VRAPRLGPARGEADSDDGHRRPLFTDWLPARATFPHGPERMRSTHRPEIRLQSELGPAPVIDRAAPCQRSPDTSLHPPSRVVRPSPSSVLVADPVSPARSRSSITNPVDPRTGGSPAKLGRAVSSPARGRDSRRRDGAERGGRGSGEGQPATTEIDSPHLRGGSRRTSKLRLLWALFSVISSHGNWVGLDPGISWENGNRTGCSEHRQH